MEIQSFNAQDLFSWLVDQEDFLLLDVRNDEEFGRFKVEGPYPIGMLNISYFDFMEIEDECIAQMPDKTTSIRIVWQWPGGWGPSRPSR